MRQTFRTILTATAAVAASAAFAAGPFAAGRHYIELPEPQPVEGDAIVVTEFFSYACPHCYHFEETLGPWREKLPEDVRFERIPVVFRDSWRPLAQFYYAAVLLGEEPRLSQALFRALHEQRRPLSGAESFADLAAEAGVDRKAFLEAYNSFAADAQVRRAITAMHAYRITGVPAVAVNGKYLVSSGQVKTYDELLAVVDHLIERERAARASAAKKTAGD